MEHGLNGLDTDFFLPHKTHSYKHIDHIDTLCGLCENPTVNYVVKKIRVQSVQSVFHQIPKISLQILSARESFSTLNAFLDAVRVMLDVDIPATSKRSKEAEIALAQARAAGERFRGARSRLYREVVQAYGELQANSQFREETEITLRLLQRSQDLSTHRFHSGTAVALIDIRKVQLEIETQRSELRGLDNQRTQALASLNRLLNREAIAPIGELDKIIVQLSLPESGAMRLTALQRNPALREARALTDAATKESERAALEILPDYGVSVGIDDMLVPYLGASLTLPINRPRIDAAVRSAEAERAATLARLRNAESDLLARLTLAEAAVRDSERVLTDVGQKLVPETQELLELQQSAYGSGEGEVLPILDTERALSSLRRLLISARTKRLGAYAEIAELLTTDLFELFPENGPGLVDDQGETP